jgi:hypothetical protein
MKKTRQTAAIFLLLTLAFACRDDEKNFASIEGKWQGTLAEIEVKPFGLPIPFSRKDETFHNEIEFNADGTMTVLDDTQPTQGTYQLVDDKLTTDINFSTEIIELSGTYTIETLTQTTLVFYLKKKDSVTDPDTGLEVSGDIKATLHFERR